MPDIRIEVLGRFDVIVDGTVTGAGTLRRRQASALIKLLALAPGHALHRERLLDQLWPDDSTDEALPKLHKAAHFARRACDRGDAIEFRGDLVQLFPGREVVVDSEQFTTLARRALDIHDAATARLALTGYHGELLPQDRYEEWAEAARGHLDDLRLQLLRLAERWEDLVILDPGNEIANLEVMKGYLAAGDRHAALRQFERLDRALSRELGVAPSAEAKRLRERALASEQAPVVRRDEIRLALIGREREVSLIDALLTDAEAGHERVVLVTGPPGVGKSALLAEWRREAERRGLRAATGMPALVEGSSPYAPVIETLCAGDRGGLGTLSSVSVARRGPRRAVPRGN